MKHFSIFIYLFMQVIITLSFSPLQSPQIYTPINHLPEKRLFDRLETSNFGLNKRVFDRLDTSNLGLAKRSFGRVDSSGFGLIKKSFDRIEGSDFGLAKKAFMPYSEGYLMDQQPSMKLKRPFDRIDRSSFWFP